MKMTTPFKAADEFEKELKEFSKKHRITLAEHSKRISDYFEMSCYSLVIRYYIKKGYISSFVNYVTNALEPRKEVFTEIYQALLAEVPDYKTNVYLQKSKAIQMIIRLCISSPKLAMPLLRFYAKRNNIVS